MTLGVLKYTFDSFQRFITWPSTPEFKISSVSPKNLVTYQHDRWLLVTNCSCDTVRCLTNVKNRLRQISVKSCAVIAYFNQSVLSSSLQIRRTVTYSSQVQPMDYTCSCGISFILCCCLQQVVHQCKKFSNHLLCEKFKKHGMFAKVTFSRHLLFAQPKLHCCFSYPNLVNATDIQ